MPTDSTLKLAVLQKYLSPVFVETGTHDGGGVQVALDAGFEKVISVEIDEERQKQNTLRFQKEIDEGRVTLITGDIIDEFGGIVESLTEQATFFLDAHWDFGVEGKSKCPLYFELDQIAKSDINNHKILIDDRRCFGEGHHWGNEITELEIIKKLQSINSDYEIGYEDNTVAKNDIIVAS